MTELVPLDRMALAIPDEVTIPRDVEEAALILDAVGGLMTAGKWGTAAIVYAFTYETDGRPRKSDEKSPLLTLSDFADLKLRGLSTRDSVRKYRQAWQHAMDCGAAELPEPGKPIKLPPADFKMPGEAHVSNNSGDNEWYTPRPYIHAARAVMGGIDLDPASSATANEVVEAEQFYDEEANGLERPWHGRVWMNPPYAQPYVTQFAEKLAESYGDGDVTQAIVLVNNATETAWFHAIAAPASAICLPLGRIKFWHPDKESAPLQGQAVLYLGDQVDSFIEQYGPFGLMVVRRG